MTEAIEQLAITCRELRERIRVLEREKSELDFQGTKLGDMALRFGKEKEQLSSQIDELKERASEREAAVEFWRTQAEEAGKRRGIAEEKLAKFKQRKAKR